MNLEALRASARSKADEDSSGFITDPALDRFINEGRRFLRNKIIGSYEDYYDVEGTTASNGLISIVAGTYKYALPTTLQKLTGVEWRSSSSTSEEEWQTMKRVQRKARNQFSSFNAPSLYGTAGLYGYYSNKDYIYLVPTPQSAFTVRLWGVHRESDLSSTTAIPDSPEEFHELIADFASMRCLGKSGEGIWKEIKDLFELQLSTFLETVGHRDEEPESIIMYEEENW